MPPPGDSEFDLGEELRRRLQPHLEEVGVEAFVIIGYARGTDGRTKHLVAVNPGQDAAIRDGLRPAILFAMGWSGALAAPVPPNPDEKSDAPG